MTMILTMIMIIMMIMMLIMRMLWLGLSSFRCVVCRGFSRK